MFCVVTLVCLVSLPLYQHSLDNRDTLGGNIVKGTEGHLVQGTHGHLLKETQGHLVKETEGHLVQGTEGHLVKETEGHLVQGTEGHLVKETDGHLVQGTEGHLVQGIHGQQELLGYKQTSATEAERKVAGLVERMRGLTKGLLDLAVNEEGEEEEEVEEKEEKKLVVMLKQYCLATLDNLDKLQEEWEL